MERIVLFNTPDTDKIAKIVTPMKIKVIIADTKKYNETLKEISSTSKTEKPSAENAFTGKIPAESLLLFCDIADKKIDKILFQLRKNNINIDFKAVLTPTNSSWNVLKLYLAMEREKAFYNQYYQANLSHLFF